MKLGYSDPPITSFRLKNMLTGCEVPMKNTMKVVGDLPFSLDDSVEKTIDWLREHKELKTIKNKL